MKKIKDERLLLLSLKNIRIAFGFQTLGILAILIYDGFKNGFLAVHNNPLWLVFIGTGVILAFLNMRISVDVEDSKTNTHKKKDPYYQKVLLSLAIGAIIGLLMWETGSAVKDSLITGIVVFVCFLISYSIVHYLRKKRTEDDD